MTHALEHRQIPTSPNSLLPHLLPFPLLSQHTPNLAHLPLEPLELTGLDLRHFLRVDEYDSRAVLEEGWVDLEHVRLVRPDEDEVRASAGLRRGEERFGGGGAIFQTGGWQVAEVGGLVWWRNGVAGREIGGVTNQQRMRSALWTA